MSTAPQQEQPHPAIRLRLATLDDVPALVNLFATFFNEACYREHLAFDPAACTRYVTTAIRSGFSPHIVADFRGRIVGQISYHLDDSFSDGKLAVLDEVYALPEWVRSPIGRALVHAAMDMAKRDGATCMHIPISSGHKRMPSLINLFQKIGAEQIGVIMRKVL